MSTIGVLRPALDALLFLVLNVSPAEFAVVLLLFARNDSVRSDPLHIAELRVHNLRNLEEVSIRPHSRLNLIVGNNGAGKTSLLESIVVLSRGRSFRTSHAAELAGAKGKTFNVFAKINKKDEKTDQLGLEREGSHWKARKNSVDLRQISQLTRSLPIVLMEPNSHLLVSGTPDIRRRYMDSGVFHVKHEFLEVWTRFSKALKQRNAALRHQQDVLLDSLEAALVPSAEALDDFRSEYISHLKEKVSRILSGIDPELGDTEIRYARGWGDESYSNSLVANRQREMDRGTTLIGPHRADLEFLAGKTAARAIYSRGEQKSLSAALLLAQAEALDVEGEKPIILMDDLASEFDSNHFDAVLEMALETGDQVWISGTSLPHLTVEHSVFHVEHGVVREVV